MRAKIKSPVKVHESKDSIPNNLPSSKKGSKRVKLRFPKILDSLIPMVVEDLWILPNQAMHFMVVWRHLFTLNWVALNLTFPWHLFLCNSQVKYDSASNRPVPGTCYFIIYHRNCISSYFLVLTTVQTWKGDLLFSIPPSPAIDYLRKETKEGICILWKP